MLRGKGRKEDKQEKTGVPEASFPSLILTLAAGALQHMGLIESPVTKKREKNLKLAKHTVDTLGMLKKKTKGNLQKEEEKLLDELVHDLRVKYVRAKGKGDMKESKDEEQAEWAGSEKKEDGS